MKLFIGTLYSGENEFEDCLASIQNQSYKNFEHFVFRDLPNREAHHALFKSFIDKKDAFDLLIKVDADMVIYSPNLFANIVNKMTQNPTLDVFSIGVFDFFTGEMIQGLNTYRNTVKWNFNQDTMFVDIPVAAPENSFYDQTELAPAAIHCKNPSKYQAFHYGVHRGLKSIQKKHSTTHWAMLERVWQNFLRTDDERIGLAVLGAELVYAGIFTKEDVDYTNPKVKEVLEKYQDMDHNQIKQEVTKQRFLNWGFLPSDLRRRVLRRKFMDWWHF